MCVRKIFGIITQERVTRSRVRENFSSFQYNRIKNIFLVYGVQETEKEKEEPYNLISVVLELNQDDEYDDDNKYSSGAWEGTAAFAKEFTKYSHTDGTRRGSQSFTNNNAR